MTASGKVHSNFTRIIIAFFQETVKHQALRNCGAEIVKKLGTETFIKETYGVDDAKAWARSHVNELNAVLPVPCHTIFLSCCP